MSKFLSSPKMEICWAGFKSDTYSLQQAGWQLSIEENILRVNQYCKTLRLAIKHPQLNVYGISQGINISPKEFSFLRDGYFNAENNEEAFVHYCLKIEKRLDIQHLTSRMSVVLRYEDIKNFKPIDAKPQFQFFDEYIPVEKLNIFRPIGNSETKNIIVPKHSVPELLDLILEKQDPYQAEMRKKKRKEFRKLMKNLGENDNILIESELFKEENVIAQILST